MYNVPHETLSSIKMLTALELYLAWGDSKKYYIQLSKLHNVKYVFMKLLCFKKFMKHKKQSRKKMWLWVCLMVKKI